MILQLDVKELTSLQLPDFLKNCYSLKKNSNMEFSPGEWTCLPAEDFELAVPRNPGTLGLEVMAQVRINGRVVDHVRTALGGSEILRVNFNTRDIFLAANLPATPLQLEMWPRDISVRRNMASSEWIDVNALIASNTILVTAGEAAGSAAPPNNADLVAVLNEGGHTASIRWAVGVGDGGTLELLLQSLPAAAAVLSGKPALRG